MPTLADLANNLPNYQYYSGLGNFNANKLPADSGQLVVRKPGQQWNMGISDTLTPFGAVTTATRTKADVTRMSKFLYTTTQGAMFLAKQTGLQLMNPEIEHDGEVLPTNKPTTGQGIYGNVANSIANFANKQSNDYGPTRIYDPLGLTTLAEVGVVATGIRFTKHGLLPEQSDSNSYTNYILTKSRTGDGSYNRLSQLIHLVSNPNYTDPTLIKYKGGPDSFYGIGNTVIRRANYNGVPNANVLSYDLNSLTVTIPLSQIINISNPGVPGDKKTITIGTKTYNLDAQHDFRIIKNDINREIYSSLPSFDYKKLNLETRLNIGRSRTIQEKNTADGRYWVDIEDASDHINRISLFYSENVDAEQDKSSIIDYNGKPLIKSNSEQKIGDIIKFRIKSYDNDTNGKGGVYMLFRAYITNIKRSINSKWNPYNYVGRGESFYLYDGFTESVTFQFTIAASSRGEMKSLYQKLNYLISTMAPDYNSQNRMRGNISELTIGDFIKYQPGIITNLDISINDDYNWDIALLEPAGTEGRDGDMHELPHMLDCSMTFIPIYNFLPRKSAEAPFIGIDDKENRNLGKDWVTPKNPLKGKKNNPSSNTNNVSGTSN